MSGVDLVITKLLAVSLAVSAGYIIYQLASGAWHGWGYAAWAGLIVFLAFFLGLRAVFAEVLR